MDPKYMLIYDGDPYIAKIILRTIQENPFTNWYHIEAELGEQQLIFTGADFWVKNTFKIVSLNQTQKIANSYLFGYLYCEFMDFEVGSWLETAINRDGFANFYKFRKFAWEECEFNLWLDLELELHDDEISAYLQDLDRRMNPSP
jgi:hypothetical protein